MKLNGVVHACAVLVAPIATIAPANAAVIALVDQGGVPGSPAATGFGIAAAYWGAMLTNDVTIRIGVTFGTLRSSVIGATSTTLADYAVADWERQIAATRSTSTLDRSIVLPGLIDGGATFITSGVDADGSDDASAHRLVTGDTIGSRTLFTSTSVLKAIGGYTGSAAALDGAVAFNSRFAFDFDPSDGIDAGTIDFLGVAIHEIGHALGFVSGVDYLDYYGGGFSPGPRLGISLNDDTIYTAFDMFRYSRDPDDVVPGALPSLDLSVGAPAYFSIDGGRTALFGNSLSTGRYNGDGNQASHWKGTGCAVQFGIMDPTPCWDMAVTALDLAALDAMGWNTGVDVLLDPGYRASTASIYRAFTSPVPEPATWLTMLVGFAVVVGVLRRRDLPRRRPRAR